MTGNYKAICLKAVDYDENDKMLLLFTAEAGKVSARIKGVKKPTAKLKFCAQPFCFGEYELTEKFSRHTIINCLEIESFSALSKNVDAYYCGSVMLEFCSIALQEGESNVQLFLLLLNSLKRLTEISPQLVLIKFLLQALKIVGFGLDFSQCTNCQNKNYSTLYLDLVVGGTICPDCTIDAVYQLSPAETTCFKMVDQTPYDRLQVLKYENRYQGMLRALNKYLEVFLKKLNSLQFLI
ncbi:MAG: DNA repair protein RecO [Clostridia bacterium]|nr:DNA repair protein RecO [Clostridia bacterium]